jgi:hypothetical protein
MILWASDKVQKIAYSGSTMPALACAIEDYIVLDSDACTSQHYKHLDLTMAAMAAMAAMSCYESLSSAI